MMKKTDSEWKNTLSDDVYRITREKGTEPPGSGQYYLNEASGTYHCACCQAPLFSSNNKYHSGSGWPSFFQPINDNCILEHRDTSHGMVRVEITCRQCDGHLGHVFPDGPQPTGLRYCVNSLSLDFKEE
ncbi:peptide-methionine (R)-S-oxide reductase MsrB [Pleionea sp. CnH1-48]|uniref:peptide-methionine (R)-S-oxide reductase MsrB n=1 Tax=Pleionea sp. CnH1-48 TaxID=2954494 RepID=UPI002096BE10|nr:peptide-methionine (R)-S-oxide reductase MsrB [Pleionea sp. CnH1-48]MCO7226803.1 peptide-methionine (R)-S-oxide reductase MsrB [Pleionea sp. CnH1-48]